MDLPAVLYAETRLDLDEGTTRREEDDLTCLYAVPACGPITC